MRLAQHDETPLVIVDESYQGIFPLSVPKIAGWENNWQKASKVFQKAMDKEALKSALEIQGFSVADKSSSDSAVNELVLKENNDIITVKHGEHVLMTRYSGNKALGYLRQKQLIAKQQFTDLKAEKFHKDIKPYVIAINPKGSGASSDGDGNG